MIISRQVVYVCVLAVEANRHVARLVITRTLLVELHLVELHLAARVAITGLVAQLHGLSTRLPRIVVRDLDQVRRRSAFKQTPLDAVDAKEEHSEESEHHSVGPGDLFTIEQGVDWRESHPAR